MAQYSRVFITLTQDRAGYGLKGREPSGRAIVEVKAGQGKVTVMAQDLKQEVNYKAYIVSSTDGGRAVRMGSLSADERGKCELKWEFDPVDVGKTGIAIGAFDVVTVTVLSKSENTWVLTGYRDHEVRFKDSFNESKPPVAMQETAPKEVARQEVALQEAPPQEVAAEAATEVNGFDASPEPVEETTTVASVETTEVSAEEAAEAPAVETAEPSPTEPEPDSRTYEYFNISDDDPTPEQSADIHQSFRAMAQRFNKELEELENLMLPPLETGTELERIMAANVAMSPFRAPGPELADVKWVRITCRELAYLPQSCWRLMHEPFVMLAYSRYRHLMLGAAADGQTYILALPEAFDPARESYAKQLGFDEFRPCDNIAKEHSQANYGYWLMRVRE